MATDKNNTQNSGDLQREKLRQLLLEKAGQPKKLPASRAQRRLWIVDELEQPNASYNNPCHITLRGSLDVSLLEKSFNLLIARHSILRTSFINEAGKPFQSIVPELVLTLPFTDLTTYGRSERKQRVADELEKESSCIFDLESAPLFRVKLLHSYYANESSSGEDEYVLIIVLHHIISDGWSMGVMVRDLFAIYDHLKNNASPLEPLQLQYSDFSQRQFEWLESDDYRQQMDYWENQLQGLSLLEMPTDFSRPPVKGFKGSNIFSRIDASLAKQLNTVCAEQSVTMNMLLTTAFSLLLHRYTGQADVVFGSPVANRNQADIEDLIGFFANMQVIRNQVDAGDSFLQLLSKTRENLIEAYSNQDVPFEDLVDVLHPVRDRSRNPLFQVLFAMQNEVMPSIELDGLAISRPVIPGYDLSEYAATTKVTRFDLELHCWQDEDNIRCSWVYDTELFEASTIQRMQQHFLQLLQQIIAHPGLPLGRLELLTAEEQQQLEKWNRSEQAYEADSLVQLFETQADKTPDAVAVVFEDASLSYLQFEQRANQLAHYLRSQGIGSGDLVGVCMTRSIEMLVALYGTLKAGGAYVPLDPEYPAARLGFMLEDTEVSFILSQSHLENVLPASEAPVLLLDKTSELDCQPAGRVQHTVKSSDAAYVIYTSGSTGQPKGVINNHAGIVNRLCWMQQQFVVDESDRVLQKTPYSFDVSVWEFFWPLMSGAQLVIARPDGHKDPAYLTRVIQQAAITTVHFVPSMLTAWLDYLQTYEQPAATTLKRVLCSGESLSFRLQQQFFEQMPAAIELHNLYGPTEAAVDVTHWHCRRDSTDQNVPIGHVIANTQIHILDPQMQPVPVGVSGELHIGGVQLARGYLNRAELNSEKFIDDPFSQQPGARLYRTGDLARYRSDGAIEYIGRMDNQVKLRGLRIEPGEIEAELTNIAAVKEAVVVVREDEPGAQRLVAYVVASADEQGVNVQNGEPTAALIVQLKDALKLSLPDYMVPSVFMLLEALPLSASGKIDRLGLPVPADIRENQGTEYAEPRNEIEQQLVQIWADILKLEQVGVFDNFFDLGGHSLMATQVISRIHEQMSADVPLSDMFGYPTVAELAPVVAAMLEEGEGDEIVAISAIEGEGDVPLSFAQERLWFLDQLKPGNPFYNMPLVIKLQGELGVSSLLDSLKMIISRHDSLRTRFVVSEGKPVQLVDQESRFEMLQDDLSDFPAEKIQEALATLVRKEALQSFNLEKDCLVKARLVRLAEDEHILLFTMHHIISDGWSLGVFYSELTAGYAAYSAGRRPELEPLPLQYTDFAVWQRDWLSGEVLESQLDYWRQQLEDLPALVLPMDRPRPPEQSFNGAIIHRHFSSELSEQLTAFSQQEGVSLFMTLLAAFSVLLSKYSGQDDIVVGTAIANRKRSELESLIGFFVNSLVMRTDVSGNPSFRQMVQRVNRTALDAFDHQDLPFEKLVDEIQPERDLSQNPLFQVMFALQNAPMDPLEFKGLTLQAVPQDIRTTRFDLEVHAWEDAECLSVNLIYNTDLFDEATIDRMFSHYQWLMQGLMSAPDKCIADIALLQQQEYQQIIYQWNDTATVYPDENSLQELFEARSAETPDAPALAYRDRTLDYRQLNQRANQLASYLSSCGVRPGDMVGIFLERDLEIIIGLLAILKAGGTYVPLDLDYPKARLGFMLNDANVPLLLTMSSLKDGLPEFDGRIIELDKSASSIEQESTDNPGIKVSADALAYVIYTSGSTGKPKGVCVPHKAVSRLVRNTNFYQPGRDDRIAQVSNVSFDAATFEIWGALLNGGQLIGANKDTLLNPHALSEFLGSENISVIFITTALFNIMAREAEGAFSNVHCLLFGGEAVDPNAVRRVLDSQPPEKLLHVYGPTETTTFATWHRVEALAEDAVTVPIGKAISNTTTYVLDPQGYPVPVGVPGELYIGGDGVAQGYLNRPELTAERFVNDAFSSEPGRTLYRTGDRVRYLADGEIEFLGRIDHQVKIRGFRIELGEIETAVASLPAVRDAVVIVREDEPGDKRLVAYTVPAQAWIEQVSSSQSGEHVDQWQALYEETYGSVDDDLDLTLNLTGWNSSYTGEPIPQEEMSEWVEATVARISALKPKRVLEIGCGTGLLLYRLAPACERYVGTDFSAVAQRQVHELLSGRDSHQHVELWQRMADDFSDVKADDFDTVIINSVVQYFPSMDYLATVIEGAVAAIADGGRIMIGDIRSLPLLKAYHTSVQLYLSTDEASSGELMRNIQQHVEEENELVIEPAFFHALKQRIPRLTQVEILLKQGRYHNELTGYRYDVLLHVAAPAAALPADGEWLEWGASGLSEAGLQQRLNHGEQAWLGINAIPNARIAGDVAVLDQLEGEGSTLTVAELKQSAARLMKPPVEPDELWRMASNAGYQLEISYTGSGADGRMDALFRRSARADCEGNVFWPQQQDVPERSWSAYGSNPLKGKLGNELIPLIRQDLQQNLPEYMVPSVFVVLDEMPLNPNGKLDRKALPVPGDVRSSLGAEYTSPRTEMEQQLAQIWAQVLKLERVGVHDNFFDLGGHSLMATQVVSRIRGQLNVELPLSEMFGYPTVAELAPAVESLLEENEGDEENTIPAVNRAGELALSFAQERLWFLDQLEPGNAAYNMPMELRLQGELHSEALLAAVNAIVQRHEVLRTRFITTADGAPVQVIDNDVAIELPITDLSAIADEDARYLEMQVLQQAEALRPFDLARDTLVRGCLLRLSENDHMLLLTMHHIISDGWSLNVLFRELGDCYRAFITGSEPELAPLPIQYADFSAWQREWLSGKQLDKQLDYWRKQLSDLEPLDLPTDHPRPVMQTYAGAVEKLLLDEQLTLQLESFSKQSGVTLFMTLLSAFMIMLHRYSGHDDVVVGSPIANRNRTELEGLIAFFVNMLVMRVDCSGNPQFDQLLKRVSEIALGAYEHQDIPFEKLVEALQVERDPSRNPLFQAQFALQNAPLEPLELEGLKIERIITDPQVTRFDLECHAWKADDCLQVVYLYNKDLFEAATIRRMLQQYRQLLQQVIMQPQLPVAQYSLLSVQEQQLYRQWNNTAQPYHSESLVQMFEAQVDKTPKAAALVYEDITLSYTQLDQRANQLAHFLQSKAVCPGDLVAVTMTRSIDMVVALYAILKAGAAYVPLDPDYPAARMQFMLQETGVKLLLTQSNLRQQLPECDADIVAVDTETKIESFAKTRLPLAVGADDAAYVIYTSGSTGQPKGVVNNHRGIVNRLCWMQQQFELDASDKVLQKTPYSFDVSVWEFFWPLMCGAQLVIAKEDGHKDPAYLTQVMQQAGITTLHFVPSMLKAWLDHQQYANETPPELLKRVLCSGEALPYALQQQFFQQMPPAVELHNLYGPTEAAVDVTHWQCQRNDERHIVPIGRAIANTQIYILDKHMQQVPVGVVGEIYIGGVQLARGYLKQAALTAERFIEDPFAGSETSATHPRLYKTGDLARYLDDGSIEYMGRVDFQVKLRGQRIELGEIESVLISLPEINNVVVNVVEDGQAMQQLVAYVVAEPGWMQACSDEQAEQPADAEQALIAKLKRALSERLPVYMLPSHYMLLDSLPLNANGKVDRKALPEITAVQNPAGRTIVEPQTDTEKQLSLIWNKVLADDLISINDDFFDIGGNSLLATKVMSRLRQEFSIELPLKDMFVIPTIAGLAEHIDKLRYSQQLLNAQAGDNDQDDGHEVLRI